MGLRNIYKDGKEFACGLTQATKLVADEGWSWTKEPTVAMKAVKKSAKPKKAKVEVKADVLSEDNTTETIDLGNIINNIKGE